MKFIKWKSFLITGAVCLLPMLFGVAVWDKLPDTMPIHFDINNNADNFASKGFAVFGLPLMMLALQGICCVINDINAKKYGERVKFERATKWIIPVMSVLLQAMTIMVALGYSLDIRRICAVIVGLVLMVIGNYLPKLDYVKNYDYDTQIARRINRFVGISSVVMGGLFIVSIFFPPVSMVVCLVLLIPYAISSVIYGISVGKKK